MRIGVALGAEAKTFLGLGGVGDLFLTCSSQKSRNFQVGYNLAQGESLEIIQKKLGSTAEGVATTKAARDICIKLNIRHAVIKSVYSVLYENCPIAEAVENLLTSEVGDEF